MVVREGQAKARDTRRSIPPKERRTPKRLLVDGGSEGVGGYRLDSSRWSPPRCVAPIVPDDRGVTQRPGAQVTACSSRGSSALDDRVEASRCVLGAGSCCSTMQASVSLSLFFAFCLLLHAGRRWIRRGGERSRWLFDSIILRLHHREDSKSSSTEDQTRSRIMPERDRGACPKQQADGTTARARLEGRFDVVHGLQ